MIIFYLFRSSFAELWHNKLRSFLSFLAIAVGVATFTYIGMSISSARATLDKTMELAGGDSRLTGPFDGNITLEDYWILKPKMPKTTVLSFQVDMHGYEGLHGKTLINFPYIAAATPEIAKLDWVFRLEGRFITWEDVIRKHNVMVLVKPARERDETKPRYFRGWDESKGIPIAEYSKKHSMLDEQILLNNRLFTVVGILHAPLLEDDLRFSPFWTPTAYIPLGTQGDYAGGSFFSVNYFTIVTEDMRISQMYSDDLERYIKRGDEEKFFRARSYVKAFAAQNKRFKDDYLDVLVLGIITLIAGGVGIMNISLAGIYARVREIGIRRALGAGKAAIVAQFLIEALILGFCGGVVGLAGGFVVIEYVEAAGQMSWWIPIGAVLSGVLTSFVFSLYPAFVASKLNPIDALKYE